jgi:hypothetical protein
VYERRFPDSLGTRDGHKALASVNPNRQGFQSRSMTRTQKEQGGVGGEREWSAFETVKIEIHTHTRAPRAALRQSRQTKA